MQFCLNIYMATINKGFDCCWSNLYCLDVCSACVEMNATFLPLGNEERCLWFFISCQQFLCEFYMGIIK